jgi:hypothetical protein
VTLWLVTFTAHDRLLGGAVAEAPTFLAALDVCGHFGLIPDGAAAMDHEIPDGMAGHLRDRWLEPGEVTELLSELEAPS